MILLLSERPEAVSWSCKHLFPVLCARDDQPAFHSKTAERNLDCHLLLPHNFPAHLTLDAIGKKSAKTGSVERRMPSGRVQWARGIKDQQAQSWHVLLRTCTFVRNAGVASVQYPM